MSPILITLSIASGQQRENLQEVGRFQKRFEVSTIEKPKIKEGPIQLFGCDFQILSTMKHYTAVVASFISTPFDAYRLIHSGSLHFPTWCQRLCNEKLKTLRWGSVAPARSWLRLVWPAPQSCARSWRWLFVIQNMVVWLGMKATTLVLFGLKARILGL